MNVYLYRTYDFRADASDLLSLFSDQPAAFLLDSSLNNSPRGRYSYLGFDPFKVFRSNSAQAIDLLRQEFRPCYSGEKQSVAFPAGIAGYLSYDYGLFQEKMSLKARDDYQLPHCVFGFYDCILTVDHFSGKLYVTSSGLPETTLMLRKKRAQERLDFIERRLLKFNRFARSPGEMIAENDSSGDLELTSQLNAFEFKNMIKKALDYIAQGEIYQVNLSQRFELDCKDTPFDLLSAYRLLRELSPSYYSAFFDAGDHTIISSSPEQFLYKEGRKVMTRPMKGTRRRGNSLARDKLLKEDMLNSPKEKAELLMVTDLERNDLGKVCEYGSVKVSQMRTMEEYKNVFQTTSTIEGTLKRDRDSFDVLKACFPSGSVTGCPKIRAMDIIEELEPTRRGIYTGSLGYISFTGDMNFNVLIRTLLSCRNKLYFQAGAGIVADSDPDQEYEETLVKAQAIRCCLKQMLKKVPIASQANP